MADEIPAWATVGVEQEGPPDWAKTADHGKPAKSAMLDESVAQKQSEAVTGIKRGITGGLGTLGDVSEFMSRLAGVDPELARKFRGFPTSKEVAETAKPVIGEIKGPSSDVTEFLANPLSYLGPGGLGKKILGALFGGVGAETGKAVGGDVGEIVGGVVGGGIPTPGRLSKTPGERATQILADKFKEDQTSVKNAADIMTTRPGVAKPLDVAGPSIQGLVERLGQTSGAGRQVMEPFLIERQQGQLGRISSDLTTLTGSKRTALQATEQTMKERADAAAPAYKAAFEAGDREIWSPELERLSGAPEVRGAMQAAVKGWQRSAIAQGYGAMNPTQVERGGIIKFGKSIPAFPNIQFWDYTKGALDNMISNEIKPDGSMTRKGRELVQINTKLRNELDKMVPEYAAARQKWAGPSNYLNALDEGRGILTRSESAEEMTAKFNALSEADKQGYREAALSAIMARLQANPAKLADLTRELRSPAMRQKIAAIMPTQQARETWNKRLDFEIRSSELVGAGLKGSQTARRLAEMQEDASLIGDLVLGVVTGHPKSTVITTIMGGLQRARDALRAKTDTEMAKFLTGQGISKAPPKEPAGAFTPYGERNLRNLLVTLGGQNAGQ